jgi:hypothetical protein
MRGTKLYRNERNKALQMTVSQDNTGRYPAAREYTTGRLSGIIISG